MLKYLLLIVALVWLFYSPALRGLRRSLQGERPRPPSPAQSSARVEPMLRCARCGIHLPASEAVRDQQGRDYCSPAHRDAGPRPEA